VPKSRPLTNTTPTCSRLIALAPVANNNGNAPNTIAAVVIKMGRRRMLAASTNASCADFPASCNLLANCVIKMPCFAINPTRVTSAITVYKLIEPPINFNETSAPTILSGTASKIISGSTKLSNCALNTK